VAGHGVPAGGQRRARVLRLCVPDLLRLLRLHRHRARRDAALRPRAAGELRPAVPRAETISTCRSAATGAAPCGRT
jgi:hypothetical protein